MAELGADTDLLRGAKLEPAQREMLSVERKFASAVAQNNPPGKVRAEIDQQIHEGLDGQIELVRSIIEGIARIARGDSGDVDGLREILSRAEESNTDLATHNDGNVKH
ncbi:hypothetical protein ACWDV4_28940 [Micromonospora sp. NPDC003197]